MTDLRQEVLATLEGLRDILSLYVTWDKNRKTLYVNSLGVRLSISKSALESFEISFGNFPSLKLLRRLDVGAIRELLKFFMDAVKEGKLNIEKTEREKEIIYTISYGETARAIIAKYVG